MSKEGKHPYVTHYSINNEPTVWSRTTNKKEDDNGNSSSSDICSDGSSMGTDMPVLPVLRSSDQGDAPEGSGLHSQER